MTKTPFMPKATAVWLVENTTLTFKQIAEFCNLHELEIKGIADGDVAKGIKAYNPILAGQLSRDEIESCSKDPQKKLTEAVEHKKNENWEMAFKALHEAYERMKYSEIDYGIDKFLRLPMYLHAAGKKDIAWKILNNYLRGEYPVIKGEKNLSQQVLDQLEIKDKMRVVLEREKKFTQSLLFFCEVQYLNIQNLKEISKWDFDSRETKSFHKKRLAEASSLKKISELLKPKLKKAKLSGQEEKIAKQILRIFKKNINPIVGTNEVRNSVAEIIKNSLS